MPTMQTRDVSKRAPLLRTQPIENVGSNLEEVVRARAYIIFQARCSRGLPGDALTDWLQAEREVQGRATVRSS